MRPTVSLLTKYKMLQVLWTIPSLRIQKLYHYHRISYDVLLSDRSTEQKSITKLCQFREMNQDYLYPRRQHQFTERETFLKHECISNPDEKSTLRIPILFGLTNFNHDGIKSVLVLLVKAQRRNLPLRFSTSFSFCVTAIFKYWILSSWLTKARRLGGRNSMNLKSFSTLFALFPIQLCYESY